MTAIRRFKQKTQRAGAVTALCFGCGFLSTTLAQETTGLAQHLVEERRNTVPDITGSGKYPALKEVDPGLSGQVIYRPADLEALGEQKLGIYAFGNGACSDDAAHTRLHLLEVASHGYLAIVPGAVYSGPDKVSRPAHLPEPGPDSVLTTHKQLGEAITWALAENRNPESPYFGRIDDNAIAVSGFSCGGLQALFNARDPRVNTVVMMNSGLFPEGETVMAGMTADKTLLEDLHTPIIYILGGETDIAYEAGMHDYSVIAQVPAAVVNINKGHGGTYWEENGGAAARVTVHWLDWQLRGNEQAGKQFSGQGCGLCIDPEWQISTKGFE